MSGDGILRIDNVSGGYGRMTIVRDISAVLQRGDCLCILGRNGVGKSTLLKILAGHLPSQQGDLFLNGRSLNSLSADQRFREGLSCAMQERPVFDNLSVRDNLTLMLPTGNLAIYRPYFDAFPVLEQRLAQNAGTLSGGERKILSFVRTMAEAADVTMLDEPSEGVQPENIEKMKSFILRRKAEGGCIVVVEQHLHLAEAIADRFLVMDNGRTVLQGPAADIERDTILQHLEP